VPCLKRVDDAKLLTMPGNQNAQSPIAGLGKSALLDAAAFSDSESLRRMSDRTGQTKGFRRVASHQFFSHVNDVVDHEMVGRVGVLF